MNSVVKLEHKDVNAIPFQEASLDIWDKTVSYTHLTLPTKRIV